VRLPRVAASASLIGALAMVAVSGVAGSFNSPNDPSIDPTLFHRVEAARGSGSATATFVLDPALGSAGALEPGSALLEPGSTVVPARPDIAFGVSPRSTAVQGRQAAPTRSAQTQLPATGTTAGSAGGWKYDAEVSWYGPGFYGHRTACGLALTKSLLGVAHRTLPCGTKVTFRNPKNGKTITVPVVDRGPYVAGRHWDLTGATCTALGHCYTGPIQWRMG
jgi:rare lipoprotein A